MRYQLTKLDMAKVVVTALYNLDGLVTEENEVLWKRVKRHARLKKEDLESSYKLAKKILGERGSK